MNLKPVLVEWEDVLHINPLVSKEDAIKMGKPIVMQTLGFLIHENEERIVIPQSYNKENETYLNSTLIAKSSIKKIKKLTKSKKKSGIAVVEWVTENAIKNKALDKSDLKDLNVSKIISIGFIDSENKEIFVGEKEKKGENERNKLFIPSEQIAVTYYYK